MRFESSFPIPAVAAISFCLIGGTTPAYADLGDQLFKLLPIDGEAGDRFAETVAISGTTAVVGTIGDEDNGEDSGSAYLFDISDPASPTQLFKLLPIDGAAGDSFGRSVAISGTTAVIGVSGHDHDGPEFGSAYLFDTITGEQLAELLPNDPEQFGDSFGRSVAISGNTVVVGDPSDQDNGQESGSAYVFDISDPANPTQIAKLLPDDGAKGDRFGNSVAIGGPLGAEIAIVGANLDEDNGFDSGSAYVFERPPRAVGWK